MEFCHELKLTYAVNSMKFSGKLRWSFAVSSLDLCSELVLYGIFP